MFEFVRLAPALWLTLFFSIASQAADGWPSKPLRIVVPYAAGGNSDDIMRPVAQKLSDATGQPVLIENKPGGGTLIGTEYAARAQPDGYTWLYVPAPFVVNPSVRSKLPYDSLRDFAPVTMVMKSPLVLVVNPNVPANSVAQLIALARSKPGALSFGSGVAGAGHLAGELMKSMAGIDMVHVGYKGSSPAMTDLIGGHIQLVFSTPSEAIPQVRGGRLRALAVTALRRSSTLPDLPTIDESGLKGFDVSVWGGIAAPAKTPREIVAEMHAQLVRILALPEITDRFRALGAEAVGDTPEEFGKFLRYQIEFWGKVVRQAKIKVD